MAGLGGNNQVILQEMLLTLSVHSARRQVFLNYHRPLSDE